MILTAFLGLLEAFLSILLIPITLLSDVTLDSNIADALSDASDALDIIDTVVPVPAFLGLLGFYLTVEISIFAWKGVNWGIKKIHGIN